jgi:hypothetical protein
VSRYYRRRARRRRQGHAVLQPRGAAAGLAHARQRCAVPCHGLRGGTAPGDCADDDGGRGGDRRGLDLSFVPAARGLTRVLLAGEDISEAIRSEPAAPWRHVAAMTAVRAALLERQRRFAQPAGTGRRRARHGDRGVPPRRPENLPHGERARSRARGAPASVAGPGESVTLARLLETIEERDARDRNRAVTPRWCRPTTPYSRRQHGHER